MVTKSKKEDKSTKAEEIVPYKCYTCSKYDGTFGPESDQHTHVCEKCKELPTSDELYVIEEHYAEYMDKEGQFGEDTLTCEECDLERDECLCDDNPVREERIEKDKALTANKVAHEVLERFGVPDQYYSVTEKVAHEQLEFTVNPVQWQVEIPPIHRN